MRVVSVYAEDGELLSFEEIGLRTDALTTFRGDLLPDEIDELCMLPDEPLFAHAIPNCMRFMHIRTGYKLCCELKEGNLYFE